jgi:hypothetical protein
MRQSVVRRVVPVAVTAVAAAIAVPAISYAQKGAASAKTQTTAQLGADAHLAVGPQYDSTHVYVTPGSEAAFAASWEATFGGTNSTPVLTDVTPTPSQTESEIILSPVGTLSVFDFKTPIPYPVGSERGGLLVSSLDKGVADAQADGAYLVVAPFDDPIGQVVVC